MKLASFRQNIGIVLSAIVIAAATSVAWFMLPPGALHFAGGDIVESAVYKGPTPFGVPAELRSADLVTRGKYLAKAADCEICHTAPGGALYAGGRAFKTQFGILYSSNVTADTETGIGNWSDDDFIRAVHKGIAKDGSHLYPAFPYESYTLLEDDDIRAIKAYLFSLPTVHAVAPESKLAFPFNQRWLMAFWSAFYNPDQRFRPHRDRSPVWNRGAYLVEGLGHCGDCHTPRNPAQALNNRAKFAGAVTQGWRAFNITTDHTSGIGGWTDDQLATYLSIGHAQARGAAGGPMAEVIDVSLSSLAPSDVHAIVSYLRSIPAISTSDLPTPLATAVSDLPKEMAGKSNRRGEDIFAGSCVSCHGWSGVSLLADEATLTGNRSVNDTSAINVAQIIISGEQRHTDRGVVMMPSFGKAYSDTEIAAVANYVTARFGARGSSLTAKDVAKLRE